VWELAENLERWGSPNVAILNETPSRLAQALEGVFDKVLLDAPCSGEGMFRKSDSARMDWSLQHIESCALRQSAILDEAARLVRPGGRLAYSTCTFAPEENEAVIARFLQAHPQFSLEKTPLLPGASPGRPEWVQAELPSLEQTLRFWPHHGAGEGHFIALLQRAGDASPRMQPIHKSGNTASGEARRLFRRFGQESLELEFDESCLSQRGSYLYWIHSRLPAMGSLKTIHPGLWLGVIKTGRFEPAHALAMALSRGQAKRQASLQPDEVRAYLRGEVLSDAGDDGWTLVTVDGFSLGWAKRVRGMLKNYYPKGLRHP
jgi:NOL1/NOP2/fmu family ribosome biogenesis protein